MKKGGGEKTKGGGEKTKGGEKRGTIVSVIEQ